MFCVYCTYAKAKLLKIALCPHDVVKTLKLLLAYVERFWHMRSLDHGRLQSIMRVLVL